MRSIFALWMALALAVPAAEDAAERLFREGRALFEEHDDSGEAEREAELRFRRALALNPRHAASGAYLGMIAAGRRQWSAAENSYRRALELDPNCAEARVGLAYLRIRENRNDEARALLREAVARQPRNRLALRELASVLSGENFRPTPETWREAIRCWQVLIGLDRNDRDAHYDLARAYRYLEQWSEAGHEYREVLRIGQTPDDLDVWVYSVHGDLAEMLEKQGKSREAIREWRALATARGAGEAEIAKARDRIARLEKSLDESR